MDLVYKNEQPLFVLSLVISVLFWLVLILATFGGVLLWLLLFFLIYLFAHSALISYLKGTAVRVSAVQFPDLHAQVLAACEKLGIQQPPETFLLHADGVFNAFATRFLGRDFVVLYADVVDALDEQPGAISFYIGHELGHVRRGHLTWGPVLWPAGILPLLGAAYSRAREYSCDLHGLACCQNADDALRGLAALAAGSKRWRTLSLEQYRAQTAVTGGFWMSFHELIGDYPWLTKRMECVMARAEARDPKLPRRSFLAWIVAVFVPRLGIGAGTGGGSLIAVMMVVAIIGMLAAISIPAFQEFTMRARVSEGLITSRQVEQEVIDFARETGEWPASNEDIGWDANRDAENSAVRSVVVTDGGVIIVTYAGPPTQLEGKTVIIVPVVEDGNVLWDCTNGSLESRYRPVRCRKQE
ncbi:M48 family metallopeptidase [Thiorhodovibrio frisius]|uniref:Tfp pilus assembly protein, major pilin PilA n=1 Tax=Thiorhodovibrio frisius TaxID=631362 RepID=H8Z753_9GAMM|nr:M48 family metallopeptidase [Thiorhodovibrio frisius]EIC20852.1 Tfp pilus assembly protein, major pilin PilA [Thiorhodovibrio frisius]WPL21904.1 Pilin [Thiorhodovibrio frisius]